MNLAPKVRVRIIRPQKPKNKKAIAWFLITFLSIFLPLSALAEIQLPPLPPPNPYPSGTLLVKKIVENKNGGTKESSDFTMKVIAHAGIISGGSGPDTFSVTFPGSVEGEPIVMGVGKYEVSETELPGYKATYTDECFSDLTGIFYDGESRTCIVTNSDIAPKLTVVVQVTNDNSGTKLPQDFTATVTSSTTPTTSFPGSSTGTEISLISGSYAVNIPGESGYDIAYSPACVGSLDIGQTATCTITLNDISTGGSSGGGGSPTPTGADLGINKIASVTSANVNDAIIYTLTVTNNGPETASSVVVSDILDSQLTFVSASSSVGTYASSTGQWLIGDLANGQNAVLEITATINAKTEGNKIPNVATVSSDTADPGSGNNSGSADVTVNSGGGGSFGPRFFSPSSGGSGVPEVPNDTKNNDTNGEVNGTSTVASNLEFKGLEMPTTTPEILGAFTTNQLPRTGAGWLITLLSAVVAGIVAFGVSGYRLKF